MFPNYSRQLAAAAEGSLRESARRNLRIEKSQESQIALAELTNLNLAREFHRYLSSHIAEFDANLDDAHEVGVRLVSFGQALTFHVENIGYDDPSLIVFYGTSDDGLPITLVQHVSQISFLLTSLKRKNPDEPKRQFGFRSPDSK